MTLVGLGSHACSATSLLQLTSFESAHLYHGDEDSTYSLVQLDYIGPCVEVLRKGDWTFPIPDKCRCL
jgi:hypothetical protein